MSLLVGEWNFIVSESSEHFVNIKFLVLVLATLAHFLCQEALKPVAIFVIFIKDSATFVMFNTEDVPAWSDPTNIEE